MKQYSVIIADIIAFFVITFLAYKTISSSMEQAEENDYAIANHIFKEIIIQDRDIRIEGQHKIHKTRNKTNSIKLETSEETIIHKKATETTSPEQVWENKEFTASQLYLMIKNPIQASQLDTMFRAALLEKGIPAQTAVIYQGRFNKLIQKDSSKVRPLKKYSFITILQNQFIPHLY